jgi:flagellar biosynthesis/type III secretory pathway protein FliH
MTDEELERRFDEIKGNMRQIEENMRQMETRIKSELTEVMRDMQTELLRGFEAFSTGQILRLRKLEADNSNLDASLSGRMDALEKRLMQIELKLAQRS